MPAITNDAMLINFLSKDFGKVIDDLGKWLVGQVKQSVISNVYMVGNEPVMYQRLENNGGFLGAWEKEATVFAGNYISAKVWMNPDKLTYNEELHQHTNLTGIERRNLDELIMMGDGYDFGGNAALRRDYWSEIQTLVESGEMDSIFEFFMAKHGIKFERIL